MTPVDEEQRFALEARGVPTADAERLIVAGFLGEVLERVPVPSAIPALKASIAAKLTRQRALEAASDESELETV